MTVTKIADAKEDFDHWLEVRKRYLTSSEFFTWIGEFTKETDWWEDTRDDVLFVKAGGVKEFDTEAETSMLHGSFDEENVLRKFGAAAGCVVAPQNGLYVNDRWPNLAASIDCIGYPAVGAEPVPEFCQNRKVFPRIHKQIEEWGKPFIVEAKKSTSTKWQTKCPDYYVTQTQTQMAVLECPRNIIVAECVAPGKKQKWRKYWDLRAYAMEPDMEFVARLDEINEEVRKALDTLKG